MQSPYRHRKIGIALVVFTVLIAGAFMAMRSHRTNSSAFSPASTANATVKDVVDGDTIVVMVRGQREKVRLIGIDTPESVDPRRPVGCYGKEASAFTKSLLPKQTKVRLELDVEARDTFHRLLAYVYRTSDNLFVNAELARQGYATTLTLPPNIAMASEFRTLVSQAREANVGLWHSCPPMALK